MLACLIGVGTAARATNCPGIESLPEDANLEQLIRLQDLHSVLAPNCDDDADFLWLRGTLARRLGAFEQASNWLERSLLLTPQRPGALLDFALARQSLGDRATAKQIYEQLLRDHAPPEVVAVLIRNQLASLARDAALEAAMLAAQRQQETPVAISPKHFASFLAGLKGQWSMVRGFDSNLNSAPSAREITFTTLDGPLVLALDAQDRPRSAPTWQLDGRVSGSWLIDAQSQWGLSARTWARLGAPEGLQSQSLDLGVDYARHLSEPIRLEALGGEPIARRLLAYGGWQHIRFGGRPLLQLGRAGMAHEWPLVMGERLCRWQQGLEAELRHYPERAILDGRATFLGTRLLCYGNKTQQEFFLRLGRDEAQSEERAGGDQARADLGAALSWETSLQRVRLQWFTTVNSDSKGYNLLIQNDKKRLVARHGVGIEYALKGAYRDLEWLIGGERYRQQSSLTLFTAEGWSVVAGLRKRF